MRVLSTKQPWAILIARGIKRFEAKKKSTPFRGRIAIHASTGVAPYLQDDWDTIDELADAFARLGWIDMDDVRDLPRGAVVGTVDLVDVKPAVEWWSRMSATDKALCFMPVPNVAPADYILWEFANPVLIKPATVKGKLNLWTLPDGVAKRVAERELTPLVPNPVDPADIEASKEERHLRRVMRGIETLPPVQPSAELAVIVGPEPLTHMEIMKRVWAYITDNGLQNRKDRAKINVDDALRGVVGRRTQVSMFDLTSYVSEHVSEIAAS